MKSHHPLVWVLGFTAFVMNPAFACSSSPSEDEFDFGVKEMIGAVQGTWRLTYARPDATSVVTFSIAPGPAGNGAVAAPPGLSPQCGSRTFTRPAAVCIPTSRLELAVSIDEADPPLDVTTSKGSYTVFGATYVAGQLELTLGPQLLVTADIASNNEIRQTYVDWQGARVTSLLDRVPMK